MTKSELLLNSPIQVFNLQNLAILWSEPNPKKLREKVLYYIRTKRLQRIQNGIYSKNKDYSSLELAQKLVPLSYISGLTALNYYGLSFQYYEAVDSCSPKSKSMEVAGYKFRYHKLDTKIFFNPIGIIQKVGYSIASPERAVCESLLFYPGIGIEKIQDLDKDKLLEIVQIYNNKRLESRIKKLYA